MLYGLAMHRRVVGIVVAHSVEVVSLTVLEVCAELVSQTCVPDAQYYYNGRWIPMVCKLGEVSARLDTTGMSSLQVLDLFLSVVALSHLRVGCQRRGGRYASCNGGRAVR